jgi:hypothetical protein
MIIIYKVPYNICILIRPIHTIIKFLSFYMTILFLRMFYLLYTRTLFSYKYVFVNAQWLMINFRTDTCYYVFHTYIVIPVKYWATFLKVSTYL